MSSNYDVTLDGTGYMLLPGSYRSYPDGNLYVDSRLGRQVLTDFSAGLAGPKPNARTVPGSALYGEASLGAWPAPWPLGVSAVGPAPRRVASGFEVPADELKCVVRSEDAVYISAGDEVWKWDHSSSFIKVLDAPADIVDMHLVSRTIMIAYGDAGKVSGLNVDTLAHTSPLLDIYADRVSSIGRRMWTHSATAPTTVQLWNVAGTQQNDGHVDGPILAVTPYENQILMATAKSIYAHIPDGTSNQTLEHWGVVSSDGLRNADDYRWLLVFQGRLMTWMGGRVVVYDKQRGWWRHAGLEGAASNGAALVNGWLIVSIIPRGGGAGQLWGYNGSGWWLLDEGVAAYPAGARGDRLIAWQPGGAEIHYWEMDSGRNAGAVAEQVTLESALLDGGSPDRDKFWTQVGVELARADPAAVGEWTAQLGFSLDAGATWAAAGDPQTIDGATATITGEVGASSRYLRVRLTLSQVSGLPPFVQAIWGEYEVLNDSVRRRRWQFRIAATDRVLNRAGSRDARDGADVRAALWNLFEGADTFSFTDVDGQERDVRMIGLREEWQRPADVPKLGAHTTFDVVLVEL